MLNCPSIKETTKYSSVKNKNKKRQEGRQCKKQEGKSTLGDILSIIFYTRGYLYCTRYYLRNVIFHNHLKNKSSLFASAFRNYYMIAILKHDFQFRFD